MLILIFHLNVCGMHSLNVIAVTLLCAQCELGSLPLEEDHIYYTF